MVYFIGAGPGDVDLITVKGRDILTKADVIIYAGSLVNRELLSYAKSDCEIYNSAYMNLDEVIEVMEKAEKLAYNDSEVSADNKCMNEDKEEDGEDKKDEEEVKSDAKSMNAMAVKVANAIKAENAKTEKEKVKAYNAACGVIGDFNPFGMSAKDMYVKALNHLGVELNGKESSAELSAMLKACSSISSKVDNGFSYDYSETKEEKNFNI